MSKKDKKISKSLRCGYCRELKKVTVEYTCTECGRMLCKLCAEFYEMCRECYFDARGDWMPKGKNNESS